MGAEVLMEYIFMVMTIVASNVYSVEAAKVQMERESCMDLVEIYNDDPLHRQTFAVCMSVSKGGQDG